MLAAMLALLSSCAKLAPPQPPDNVVDTTSHNFTWQVTALGDGLASSMLNDVAIVNDTLVYAVGAIYLKDSTEKENPLPYNVAIWNGNVWKTIQMSVDDLGNIIAPPLYSVLGFSSSDIWLSDGVPIHGDGKSWIEYNLYGMGILTYSDGHLTKMWGLSSSDLYFVGSLGTIVHYNGSAYQKLQS